MSSEQSITSVAIMVAAAIALSIAGCDKTPPSMPPEEPGAVDVDDQGRANDDGANEPDASSEPLSKTNFDEVINDHFDEVSDCYIAALGGAPDLQGTLNAEFTIDANGRVINLVAVDGSTLDDPGMIACITEAAASWRFAQPAAGELTLPYSFNLAPG